MKRAIAAAPTRVHAADCGCRDCAIHRAAPAPLRLSDGAVAVIWTSIGLAGAISALAIADWLLGGHGVQVMFGFAGRY